MKHYQMFIIVALFFILIAMGEKIIGLLDAKYHPWTSFFAILAFISFVFGWLAAEKNV